MFQTTKGIVLRETEYKDNDKILTLLTGDAGLVTVRAWGVKRKNSALRAGCQLLTYSEFTIQEKQGFRKVQEAVPIEMFTALRSDIELLSLGSYFAQTVEVLGQEDCPDPELLLLLLHSLHALCIGRDKFLVKAAFELRLAALAGYAPDLEQCIVCSRPDADRFDVALGSILCNSCRVPETGGLHLPVSPGTLDAMRYIVSAPTEKVFSFTLGDSSGKELVGICETYLLTKLERGFYTLDFFKSLLLT